MSALEYQIVIAYSRADLIYLHIFKDISNTNKETVNYNF